MYSAKMPIRLLDGVYLVSFLKIISNEILLFKYIPEKSRKKLIIGLLLVFTSLSPSVAMAQLGPGVDQMFANFSGTSIAFFNLVMKVATLLGIIVTGKAVLSFKEYSESGGRTPLKTPLTILVVGICLWSFPTAMNTATNTLALGGFTGTNLMSDQISSGGGMPGAEAAIKGVLLFVKLVGIIAACRGFLMFKKIGEGGGGNASTGSALTHVLGGAACVNIQKTYELLASSVGWA